jgi:hypothetical protein
MLQIGVIQQHNAGGTIGRMRERGAAVTEEGYRRMFKGALVIDEELTQHEGFQPAPLDIARLEIPVKIFAD